MVAGAGTGSAPTAGAAQMGTTSSGMTVASKVRWKYMMMVVKGATEPN